MALTALVINGFAVIALALSLLKDRAKTKQALKVARKSFIRIFPTIAIVIIVIGWLLTFVSKAVIASLIGQEAGLAGIAIAASLGSVLFIPALVSFPLAASLLKSGASLTAVATFITTLTMIGFVTLPLEIKTLGKKVTFLRNGFSFAIAIIIGLLMGVILR